MEFTPITTQEDFDKAIGERLKRERETLQKKYSDYDDLKAKADLYDAEKTTYERTINDANTKLADYEKQIGALNSKIKSYETDSVKTRIALETGLPFEMRSRLTGENEDEIKKDAESLAKLIKGQYSPPPLKETEPKIDSKTAALKGLNEKLLKGD